MNQHQKIEVTKQKLQRDKENNLYVFAEGRKQIMKFSEFAKEAMTIDEKFKDLSVNDMTDLIMKFGVTNPKYASDQDDHEIKMLPENDTFDLNKINDYLRENFEERYTEAPGITTPMIYSGQMGSLFAAHTEDLNLASVSVLMHGKPKEWYFVPADQGEKLENLIRNEKRDHPAPTCDHPLAHKVFYFTPEYLRENEFTVHRVSHKFLYYFNF